MQCPVCGSDLSPKEYDGIAVDVCQKCRGIWFDQGELKPFITTLFKKFETFPAMKTGINRQVLDAGSAAEPVRDCPRCHRPMKKFNYAYDSHILLDRCESCNGIWTDNKEILKLASYSRGTPRSHLLGNLVSETFAGEKGDQDGLAQYKWHVLAVSFVFILTAFLVNRNVNPSTLPSDFTLGVTLFLLGWAFGFTQTAVVLSQKLWWLGGLWPFLIYHGLDESDRDRRIKTGTRFTGWLLMIFGCMLMLSPVWK
jgi:Zn-finger nucleic acid-binding protein